MMSKTESESECDFVITQTQSSDECDQNFDKIVELGVIKQLSNIPQNINIYYLGIEFNKQYLLERNKNPIFLLHIILTSLIFLYATYFGLFWLGTNFYFLFCIFCPIILIQFSYNIIIQLKMAPQKIIFTKPQKILTILARLMFFVTCILSFILIIPFNSVWILLLGIQVIATTTAFLSSIVNEKNEQSENEKFYQFNYIFNRIFIAFLNGAGLADVISDIVWSIQAIQKFHEFQKIFGVVILVLCFVDILNLIYRIQNPGKITLKFHILTIILEMLILSISVLSMTIQIQTELSQDTDFLGLAILSIFTTVVNVSHHIAIMIDFLVQQKQTSISTFS